jgi:hypothetical protein
VDLDAFRWLLTAEGQRLLASAATAGDDPLQAQAALRRTASADHVAAAVTQVRLRLHAVAKFGELAQRMYFTPEGLEQATRLPVATHRAARVRAAGAGTLLDLGCGIGGDLVAFARAGLTCAGVDLDPVRVAVARANLDALGLGGAVTLADATAVDTSPFDVAYADPARRSARGRSFDVHEWTPPWSFVQTLFARDSCVKLAPGIPHHLVPEGVEAEWVSDDREVKEAVLWSARLATTRRRATVLRSADGPDGPDGPDCSDCSGGPEDPGGPGGSGGRATLTNEDDPGAETGPVAGFLYEPDGAVIRAGLVTAVAAAVGGHLLDEHIAYVTSDRGPSSPFARRYRVLETVPFREKPLKAALRERGIGRLTIKKRGVSVTPDELRRRLSLRGEEESTLVLTRVHGKGTALLVEPA